MKISKSMWEALVACSMKRTCVYFLPHVGKSTALALERRGLVTLTGKDKNVGWRIMEPTPAGRDLLDEEGVR